MSRKNKRKIKFILWSNPKATRIFNSIVVSICAILLIFIGIPFLEKETSASSVVTNPNFIFKNWNSELSNEFKEAIQKKMKLDSLLFLSQLIRQLQNNLIKLL